MYEEIPPYNNLLDPSERHIWLQQDEDADGVRPRLLPGFQRQLTVSEDPSDRVSAKWYGEEPSNSLPQRILKPDFWPADTARFKEKFSVELELAIQEIWPKFEEDSIELTANILSILKLGKIAVADQLTVFYIEHQPKIDVVMVRFYACNIFEQGQNWDWLSEHDAKDEALTKKLDAWFFQWRIDDSKLWPLIDALGEKNILVGCRFFDFFFEQMLRKNYELAKLRGEDEDGEDSDQLSSESGGGGGNKPKPRPSIDYRHAPREL
jgi:hypothetical protein